MAILPRNVLRKAMLKNRSARTARAIIFPVFPLANVLKLT